MPRGPKPKDFSGEIHGVWKVIERNMHPLSKSHETFWICECQNCGNIASVRRTDLQKNPRSCNKCKGQVIRDVFEERGITKSPIHIGDRFGKLTVIGSADNTNRSKGYWKCQCDCGKILDIRTDHLLGQGRSGRTISCGCIRISSGELKIKQLLEDNNIPFIQQYTIPQLSLYMSFDFALIDGDNQVVQLIEFDGEQHYRAIEHFGGETQFAIQQERDARKDQYCKEQGISLQRIPYWEYDNITIEKLISETPYSEIKK